MGGAPINDRVLMRPLVGLVLMVLLSGVLYVILRLVTSPVLVTGLLLIGLGSGLVVARLGRVGPFQGEFGTPWFESDLCEMLRREVARAARFDRELTIAVVRQRSGAEIDWSMLVRAADDVVLCRNGWRVLVLPETPRAGAERLIERATEQAGAAVQAVVMDPSVIHNTPESLGQALLKLIRTAPEPDETPFVVQRGTDRLRWPA